MLITNEFTVDKPIATVWEFFGDVPQVAACLPGAELTEELGDDAYKGQVAVRMGPVKMEFDGTAKVLERDDTAKRMVIDGAGADKKGRGQASMLITAQLNPAPRGTKVTMQQDLTLSGAAAQYGRGMIQDVSAVLMAQFATNMQNRIEAAERGVAYDPSASSSAGGLAIAVSALKMALGRVFRRFFLPYQPNPS